VTSRSAPRRPRPFLKWAGGKGQLLPAIEERLPQGLDDGSITRYVEPFVGSGAVFFALAGRHSFEEAYLFDTNPDLILVYRVVKEEVDELISLLSSLASSYEDAAPVGRRDFYYAVRTRFNRSTGCAADRVERAADFLFLNRTCYNGLYRVNRSGLFNVPFGRYTRPRICPAETLREASAALDRAEIGQGDFELSGPVIDEETFVYFDPPYRPISRTSSFTGYARGGFTDAEQIRLSRFFADLDRKGARLLLSNSDPTNADPEDRFFDELYRDFVVERVPARRAINSVASRRGPVRELLVRNYD
jgi:DNA adenine methylase